MDINEFYATARTNTNGNEYSATLPNLTDYTDKGFVPYYLGWIDKDNIPETYHLTKISFDGTKLISKPLEITENADFFYTARNVNPPQIGGLSFASRYNSASGSYTSYYGSYSDNIEAVNKLQLLTQNITPPAFTFSFVYRTVSGSTFGNTLIANYNYNFTSIISFINWLNGTFKINFSSVFSGLTLTDVELSANDFLTDRAFHYTDSSYDGYIFISACTVSPRTDTNNDSTTTAGNSAIFGTTSVTYKDEDEDDTFDIYLHSQYHPTGQLQIFYSGTPRVYANPITFYGYYFGGFDIETDLAEMTATNEIYQGDNWIAYRPYNLSNYRYFYKKMSISEIKFLFAMQPILRYTNDITNVYYPKFEDNELTGEFFPASRLAFEGAPWQITGNVTDNDYDPDTKPQPASSDDDPLAKPNDPGKREGKIIGDRTGSGGAARIVPQSGVQYYVMTGQELLQLRSLVWAQTKDFYSALNIINTEGTDTIFNYISSLRYYPFSDITSFIDTSSTYSSVVMGTGATLQNTAITPYTDFTLRTVEDKGFQSMLCSWYLSDLPWRNNFLDFTPYSKLVVTIPYCGDVELDLNRVAAFGPLSDAVLWLWASGDIDSGTVTFSLFTGAPGAAFDQILYSKNIKIAIDLPLSGNDQISQSNAILQATYNQASKVLSVGSSLIGEGVSTIKKGLGKDLGVGDVAKFATDAVQGVMDVGMASAEASLAKRQVPVSIGDINGTVATAQTRQYPYLTLYRQKTANPANYGHTTGFTCEATYTLSELSGFTVLSNPDLRDVSGATQEELEELMGILTTGFYI